MKIGDLVRHKRYGDLALIIDIDETFIRATNLSPAAVYRYPKFMWLDNGEFDSCASTFLEVIDENR